MKETKIENSVLLSLFMCSTEMMQNCQRSLAPALAELFFKLTEDEPNDPKGPENIYNLHYDDGRGDV